MRLKVVLVGIGIIITVAVTTGLLDYYGTFGTSRSPVLALATLPLSLVGVACQESPFIAPSWRGSPPGSYSQCPVWCDMYTDDGTGRNMCRPRVHSLANLLNPRPEDPRVAACRNGGGTWRTFSDGCGDTCGTANMLCTAAFGSGCDCGPGACWDVSSCVTGSSAAD